MVDLLFIADHRYVPIIRIAEKGYFSIYNLIRGSIFRCLFERNRHPPHSLGRTHKTFEGSGSSLPGEAAVYPVRTLTHDAPTIRVAGDGTLYA